MNTKKVAIQITISLLSIISLIYGRLFSVPDAVSRTYGFPLAWGVHQLITIAGPVDVWNVNITNLAIDLAFWYLVFLASQFVVDRQSNT